MKFRLTIYSAIFSLLLIVLAAFVLVHIKISLELGRKIESERIMISAYCISTVIFLMLNLYPKTQHPAIRIVTMILVATGSIVLFVSTLLFSIATLSVDVDTIYPFLAFILSLLLIHAILKN